MVQFDVKRVQKGTESFMVSFDFTKTPVTQVADYIIIAASKHNASDIHFDPREDGMMVRFRIDGDCQDYTFVPKAYEKNLTTRLKLLANMNITESRLPQDGAIKGNFGDQYLDMRVSSLPLNYGEKVVIRILDYSRSLQGIDTLGFHPKNLEKIKRMMGIPNGIILTTGATGSGKSTTTYSILQGLNKPETNVITVEDPIEMNIEGINQVQVNAEIGMTFAAALRSILRQDPNVILIGEIRDSETAQIAVRASITGHLVLSTIHTNNALATVERLLDMNVERYLLSTALSGVISQRLAKMLCPDCRFMRETTKYEKKVFKKYMNMDVAQLFDANPKGCDKCRRGYHGRIAVHEVLEINDDIRDALSNENLEKKDLAKMVYGSGTITMLQDALIKCLEGKTSFEEVYRTIEIENEDDDNYENEISNDIKESIPVEVYTDDNDDGLLDDGSKKSENSVLDVPKSFTAAGFQDSPPAESSDTQNENPENIEGTDNNSNDANNTKNGPKTAADAEASQNSSDTSKSNIDTQVINNTTQSQEVIQQNVSPVTPQSTIPQSNVSPITPPQVQPNQNIVVNTPAQAIVPNSISKNIVVQPTEQRPASEKFQMQQPLEQVQPLPSQAQGVVPTTPVDTKETIQENTVLESIPEIAVEESVPQPIPEAKEEETNDLPLNQNPIQSIVDTQNSFSNLPKLDQELNPLVPNA